MVASSAHVWCFLSMSMREVFKKYQTKHKLLRKNDRNIGLLVHLIHNTFKNSSPVLQNARQKLNKNFIGRGWRGLISIGTFLDFGMSYLHKKSPKNVASQLISFHFFLLSSILSCTIGRTVIIHAPFWSSWKTRK